MIHIVAEIWLNTAFDKKKLSNMTCHMTFEQVTSSNLRNVESRMKFPFKISKMPT